MALTKAQVREILSAAGVDAEHIKDAVDKIIDGHLASVEALREDVSNLKQGVSNYNSDLEKLKAVQKELDELKKLDGAGWKAKAEDWEKKYNDLVNANTAKETKAAKEAAARAYYESKGITGKALEIAMRGSGAEIDALELDDGKIKDAAALEALVKGDFSGLVSTTTTTGANTATPPANTVGGMSRADIYKKDDKGRYVMSTAERQKAIAEDMAKKE